MQPHLSRKAKMFLRNRSPVKEIMTYADAEYLKKIGLEDVKVISFAGGWVNHKAPIEMQQAYSEIIKDEKLFHASGSYTATLGANEAKRAICKFGQYLYGTKLNQDQIAVGLGSTQMALNLFHVLMDPGDKITLLDPTYCNYPAQLMSFIEDVQIQQFSVVDKETWTYDADNRIEAFREHILTERPKVVLLISPDNPTSQVLSDRFCKAALEAVTEIGSFLVIDFAYKEIVFSEALPEYFSWAPNPNFIALHSNSKWCRGLGRRMGWVQANESIVAALESSLSSSILCPDTLHQVAFARYVDLAIENRSLVPYIRELREYYSLAAERTCQGIKEHIGLPSFTPQGGLYTCVNVGKNSAQFVEDTLKKTGVLLVPGWGFGASMNEAVRISFGPLVHNLELIDEGLEKVGRYLHSLPSRPLEAAL